jgi:hypothetical protein
VRFLGNVIRLTAATVLVAAVGLALPAAPASAATCSSGAGVSVVVDFHELGGGAQTACVADGGGKSGTALFSSAGFGLTYVQRQPGFVCRVNGVPKAEDDPCVNTPPADAYWGLWWSDGKSGQWTYATTAAGGLSVPDGGYVAFSWNGNASRSAPGVSPAAHAATPTPTTTPTSTSKPTSKPTKKPSPTPTKQPSKKPSTGASSSPSGILSDSPSGAESSTPTGSSKPSPSPTKQQSGKAGQPTKPPGGVDGEMLPESTPPSTDAAPAAAEPAEPSDGGLPTWVGPVVVVVLFAAGGAVAVVRRRRNPAP